MAFMKKSVLNYGIADKNGTIINADRTEKADIFIKMEKSLL